MMSRLSAAAVLLGAAVATAQDTVRVQTGIPGVLAEAATVELYVNGFQGAEGPVAAPDGALFFSDIPASRTYRLDAAGTLSVWRDNTNGANGLFLSADGRLFAAEGAGRRIVVVTPDRRVTEVATRSGGQPFRAPNDLILDSKGGVYFTDPAPRPAPNEAPREPGNVHYVRANGDVLLLDDQIRRPNGITLSLDEKTLYVDDTEGVLVYAFDVQADGRVTNKRPFARLQEPEKGSLGPRSRADGMAIDSRGRLYVATAAGVQVIDPDGGHLGTIRVPSIVRNVAFGGPLRRTLYMTAVDAIYKAEMLSEGPARRAK